MVMRKKVFREDIINAGTELMLLQGYGGTGIKDITDKIGIPKGSFYNHFKNKEIFGLEVLDYYMTVALGNLDSLLTNRELNPVERMKMFFQVIIDNQNNMYKYKYGCLLGNFSQELSDVNETFRKAIQHAFQEMTKKFSRCIDEARELGLVKSTRSSMVLADFLINGWEGSYLRMKAERSTAPLEEFRDILFEEIFK